MKKILLALTIGFTAMACRDKEEPQDQLPPITQHGANTAGAIVNGEIVIPKDGIGSTPGSPSIVRGLDVIDGSYFISSQGKKSFMLTITNIKKNSIYLDFHSLEQKGDYYTEEHLVDPSLPSHYRKRPYIRVTSKNSRGDIEKIYFSHKNSCKITITRLDFNVKIISGVFSGKVYNIYDPNDKIEIKDGRFDININTLNK